MSDEDEVTVEVDMSFIDRDTLRQAEDSVGIDCETTYMILDELIEQLAEACEEQTEWKEEIDRQNLRRLLDTIDEVERVKSWVREIVDPKGLGLPSKDDPIKE